MSGCSRRQEKGASGVLVLYYDVTIFTLLKIVILLGFVHFLCVFMRQKIFFK